MKNNLFIYLLLLVLTVGSVGCTKDNYEPPKSQLTGRVVYNGQPVGVRSNGVQLELWQHGYAFFTKIQVYVAQDGSFSALLFDGQYKMTRQNGIGPWLNETDSVDVKVSGNTIVDMPVTPYSIVKSATYQKNGTNITATANIETITTTSPLEAVKLYVFKTALVDDLNQDAVTSLEAAQIPSVGQPLTLSVAIPASLANAEAVYVRVGVKTAGVSELAYSPAEKIQLK